ncbi:MAG: type VI secretion system contractile sheath large subunit [Planctomycetia bacterium]|nr:type VI secretion system contractile sheath large subunit [Planctomycetia bacterium]
MPASSVRQDSGGPAVLAAGPTASSVERMRAAAAAPVPLERLVRLVESAPTARRSTGLLTAADAGATLRAWAAVRVASGERLTRSTLLARLGEDISAIDDAVGRQVDAVLHHPAFQRLESSWRGLRWLVDEAAEADAASDRAGRIEVRVLPVSKRELQRDREHAVEFDRSTLWRKVYEEEFGTAGGRPFGLLVGDYSFTHSPDDVNLLTGLSEVAAAAFCPLLANPAPDLLGIDSHAMLNAFDDLEKYQGGPSFVKWRALRERPESRFIGLPAPGVLGRLPYDGWIRPGATPSGGEETWSARGFPYRESVDGPGRGDRLWIGAVWPLASVIIREFGTSGWFADIRGGSRGVDGGGVVRNLPREGFDGFAAGDAVRGPVEVEVTDTAQGQLEEAGLIPLCCGGPDGQAVFLSNMSLHKPERFDRPTATANARISAMLQYVLCVSRFAHYVKVLARDKVGGFAEPAELEQFLNDWLNRYVTPDDQASAEVRAKLPLRAARVEVREEPGTAGGYKLVMWLQPHFQLDQLDATLKLVSTVVRTIGK